MEGKHDEFVDKLIVKARKLLIAAILMISGMLWGIVWLSHDRFISGLKKNCADETSTKYSNRLSSTQISNYCTCTSYKVAEKITRFDTAISFTTLGIYDPAKTKTENIDTENIKTACKDIYINDELKFSSTSSQ